jgi:hypothetical protein
MNELSTAISGNGKGFTQMMIKKPEESEWTFETLRQFIDEREARNLERITAIKTAMEASIASAERAIQKAEVATEKRFEAVNEFRRILSDQGSSFLPKIEFDLQYKGVNDRIVHNDQRIEEIMRQLSAISVRETTKKESVGLVGTILWGLISGIAAAAAVATVLLKLHGID